MYKTGMLHRQLPSFLTIFFPILNKVPLQIDDSEHNETRKYILQTPSLFVTVAIISWQRYIGHMKYVKTF